MTIKGLADVYKRELLDNVLPFWLNFSKDTEYGGYYTCLDRYGNVYDTDKFIWLQGRAVWMFATMCENVENRQEWLDYAISGAEFLKKYGHDGNYNWYFSLTREGKPLVQPYNIFSYAFAVMAFARLGSVLNSDEYKSIAIKTYELILEKKNNPKGQWNKLYPGTRDLKGFALPMILSNISLEMEGLIDQKTLNDIICDCATEILEQFYQPELGIVLENINVDGNISDSFEGRVLDPGHAIEAMWFIMDTGIKLGRKDMIDKATEISLKMINYGWDKEYGGIFYFMDRMGHPPQQLEWDQKLWWVHAESLVAMLKGYSLTGNKECMEWFEKLHKYTWSSFKDGNYEWFGYLNRRGEVLLPLKGGKWKGCFHVPRALLICWKLLEEIEAKEIL